MLQIKILKHIAVLLLLLVFNLPTSASLPGINQFNPDLLKKISDMKVLRGSTYKPRTKHVTATGQAKYTNRLFLESSPYLLQHAHNPVNWYPWGEEAFIVAVKLRRPVLLSVGYSTCHWCHVMEEESFEDLEIAEYINKNFIAIKVDREERPDIDAIYMATLYALGKNGGWPMNVWLTPDKKPFFGGTYFPARDGDRGSSIGLLTVLKTLNKIYKTEPEKIVKNSDDITQYIKQNLQPKAGFELPNKNITQKAVAYYKHNFDAFYGGIGNAPKFPSTTPIPFLLHYYKRTGDKDVLKIVELTLTKMAAGGIYDQVGGGFHRYSIDNEWLVPHFEKMLYDNALLAVDYLGAFQVTKNKHYKQIVDEMLLYIKRDMTSNEGGFYSATDADSLTPDNGREEGYFFTWSKKELNAVLGKDTSKIIEKFYKVSEQGNFEGRNILHVPMPINEFAKNNAIDVDELEKIIKKVKQKLYQQRKKRLPPIRDEKILVAWNGLMISAYAKAGLVLNNKDYIKQAEKAAQFIFNNMYKNGRLLRSYKDNKARHEAYLPDYAFLIAGLLDTYEATGNVDWKNKAIELDHVLEADFEDKKYGGYFMTADKHEKLIARQKPSSDNAEPSGNSVQALNLLRLAKLTSNEAYSVREAKLLKYFSIKLNANPTALSKMLLAVDIYYNEEK
ncbi:Uncharacterized protein YyaL [hydrothermal vent metagenome]|uniref:Uncharacterized protein YyaL n=1 Tax=hydrothermal vent metagenome TaxID=652676 RepID=A0A3B0XQG3_9ZZZZ